MRALVAGFGCWALALAASPGVAAGKPVTVFAASSLTEPFQVMAAPFARTYPAWTVRFSFGSSSQLRLQIEQGAPADVFSSADDVQMALLVRAGTVKEPGVFVRNRLVLWVPEAN